MDRPLFPPGIEDSLNFSLLDALFGRRARRFFLGASIPDGPLAFTSRHERFPLTELEQMMILTSAAGNTGWHYMITRHDRYVPHISNYSAAEPYMSGHNTWCANHPGSTLIIPVADVAQHLIALLCFALQNGYCIYDDVHRESIERLDV